VARKNLTEWQAYWSRYSNIQELKQMAANFDDTLDHLEKEMGERLLSGDHILIIEALENRIEDLENSQPVDTEAQGELF
jgi:predicted kinase